MVDLIGDLLARHPTAFAHTVLTADLLGPGVTEVVVTGDRPDLLAEVRTPLAARRRAGLGRADRLAAVGRVGTGDRAYVCRNYACRLPRRCDVDTADRPTDRGRLLDEP